MRPDAANRSGCVYRSALPRMDGGHARGQERGEKMHMMQWWQIPEGVIAVIACHTNMYGDFLT